MICDTEINAGTIEKKKKKQRAQSDRSLINPNRRDSEQAEEGNKQAANKPDCQVTPQPDQRQTPARATAQAALNIGCGATAEGVGNDKGFEESLLQSSP